MAKIKKIGMLVGGSEPRPKQYKRGKGKNMLKVGLELEVIVPETMPQGEEEAEEDVVIAAGVMAFDMFKTARQTEANRIMSDPTA